MKNWRKTVVPFNLSLREVLEIMNSAGLPMAFVVDDNYFLVGILSDGDLRRGLLSGISLDDSISKVMNPRPIKALLDETPENIIGLMKRKEIGYLPIVDQDGRLVRVDMIDQFQTQSTKENFVLLMAGGMGNRLRPLTDSCPKPLLKVGNKPILETIIQSFGNYGYRRFIIAVNYKADMITKYFGDGSTWGVDIQYINEEKKLGTAGAIGLLHEKPLEPFFVMNGDILTQVNFDRVLQFHKEQNSVATMCVRDYKLHIPYGVIESDKHKLKRIEEKPSLSYLVSAGIYLFDPAVFMYVPRNSYMDMPELFTKLIQANMETSIFPINEYWLDIGRIDDFEQANCEYDMHFANSLG